MRKIIYLTLCLFSCWMANGQDYLQQATACFEQGDYECAKRNYSLYQTFEGKDMSEQIQKADVYNFTTTMTDILCEKLFI